MMRNWMRNYRLLVLRLPLSRHVLSVLYSNFVTLSELKTYLMNLDKHTIRKNLTYSKNNQAEFIAIEKDIEYKIQDISTAQFVDLIPVHSGEKALTELHQKRYKRGGIYNNFSPTFDIDEVTHIKVDLHAFKEQNISLSIFELRAFLRRLKQKYNYEIAFIKGLDLVGLGEYEGKDKAFKDTLFLDQLKTIKDELFVVMVVGEN